MHRGNHTPLVDERLWDKANQILTDKLPGHRFVKKGHPYHYRVNGLLRCGKCGSHDISSTAGGRSNRKFFYYVCGRAKTKLGCDAPALPAMAFDEALIDYFKRASKEREGIIQSIGEAITESKTKLSKLDQQIQEVEKKLITVQEKSKRLLELAINQTVARGKTYKDEMQKLDMEIVTLEENLNKLQAQKKVTQISANSDEFLYTNIQMAMEHLNEAPPEAQKSLFQALIKEIIIHENRIELKMYIEKPLPAAFPETMPSVIDKTLPQKEKRPALIRHQNEALTAQALTSPGRPHWLPQVNEFCNWILSNETPVLTTNL